MTPTVKTRIDAISSIATKVIAGIILILVTIGFGSVQSKVDQATFDKYCMDNDYRYRQQEQVNKELLRTINDLNASVKEMNAHIEWLKKNNK